LREHEAGAEARRDQQHFVATTRLLVGASRDRLGPEDAYTVEHAAARQCTVEPRESPRRPMAVGGGNLGAAARPAVHRAELHRAGRIEKGLGRDRLGIILGVFEDVDLSLGRPRRLEHLPTARVVLGVESDIIVETKRRRDLVTEITAQRLAGYPPHHFADEPAESYRVI